MWLTSADYNQRGTSIAMIWPAATGGNKLCSINDQCRKQNEQIDEEAFTRKDRSGEVALTASQQRLLQLLVAGTETEEPTLLAAGRL
ncbi:hypothetical protein ICA16_14800 [Pseudomonas anatoliensis]|uniref:hypothetical protein n=1 Tax=Pseudomonas anatoliensis TaxID=2710589 RepID=UPI001B33BFB9|nr:hypothetical protein [Pseudomonas anatoliensis]MBP5956939.1 hypothetical protein [Pseudomonas anatoliensis]